MKTRLFLLCALLSLASVMLQAGGPKSPENAASVVSIDSPRVIRFSGSVVPGPSVVGVTFALYKDQSGGAPLWQEVQNVAPDAAGHYTVLLGSTQPDGLPADLFSTSDARWLGVRVENGAEQPRIQLVSVPYAMHAGDAETLGGKPASAFLLANACAQTASAPAPRAITGISSGPTANFVSSGAAGYIPMFTNTTDIASSNLFSTGSLVGINTASPLDALHVNGNIRLQGQVTHSIRMQGQASTGRLGQDFLGFFFAVDTPGKTMRVLTTPNGGSLTDNRLVVTSTGNVGIGTSTPNNALSVVGTVESTAGGFKFPDASVQTTAAFGTVTGVTAGTGLTGGGTSGSLSVALNQIYTDGRYAQLAISNTFTGSQGVTGDVTATGSVSGNTINSANGFFLAGKPVFTYDAVNTNLSLGPGAGSSLNGGSENTFTGFQAGFSNTTGGGNTFTGTNAGYTTSFATQDTFTGDSAGLMNTGGSYDVFEGFSAGRFNTTGNQNAFVGASAGFANTVESNNTYVGQAAGSRHTKSSTGGDNNVFIGNLAGSSPSGAGVTGANNTALGTLAGANVSGDANVYLGYQAGYTASASSESNTLRIGSPATDGTGVTNAYIAGIYGVAISNGVPVVIDSNGHLGASAPSSLRFKENIEEMGDSTTGLFKLRPVRFYYRHNIDHSDARMLQYGLIAEEVAEVYPELVTYDAEGRPNAIKYQYFTPMLLNELQKQHTKIQGQEVLIRQQEQRVSAQDQEIRALRLKNADLEQRLERMEAALAKLEK